MIRSEKRLREDVLLRPCFVALALRRYPNMTHPGTVTVVDGVTMIRLPETDLNALREDAEQATHRCIEDLMVMMDRPRQQAVSLMWDAVVDEGRQSPIGGAFELLMRSDGTIRSKDPGFTPFAKQLLQRAAYHPADAMEEARDALEGTAWTDAMQTWDFTRRGAERRLLAARGMDYLQGRGWERDGWFREEAKRYEQILRAVDAAGVRMMTWTLDWDTSVVPDPPAEVDAVDVLEEVAAS